MAKRLIVPDSLRAAAEAAGMSPAIAANGFLFLTGATGGDAKGRMPMDAETQIATCLHKIGDILKAAGVGMEAVVEMTSYHIGLRAQFEAFDRQRRAAFSEPYPAWTAVEVAGLRREGALVEIRVIAALD